METFLDESLYKETFETNLNKDEVAKNFWMQKFPEMINKFACEAAQSEKTEKDSKTRSIRYSEDYLKMLEEMTSNKDDFLSVRMILELNEQLLKKHGFKDVWESQKKFENEKALRLLSNRLKEIDSISDNKNRWLELFRGVLAGNIFDSGATAVQDLLNDNQDFGLEDALTKIQERPWLVDSFDDFMDRLEKGPSHNCIAFFCDNSGVDVVLGVLPFIREVLKSGTKVILCANSEPSLNDVTYKELVGVVQEATLVCPIIEDSIKSHTLLLRESGQTGCCLNFLNLHEQLVDTMVKLQTDLIVIEGMGRSLHTNLNSTFKCESLKLAVIKNKFLAGRLGGCLFDAICKYEKNST